MLKYNFKILLNLIGIILFQKLINAIRNGDLRQIKQNIVEYILYFYEYVRYFLIFIVNFSIKNNKVIWK
jgi:hypothetical protein